MSQTGRAHILHHHNGKESPSTSTIVYSSPEVLFSPFPFVSRQKMMDLPLVFVPFLLLFPLFSLSSLGQSPDQLQLKQHLPEESMSAPEIIAFWGYPCQVHEVTTQDGYILSLHRIPHGRTVGPFPWPEGERPVFFLQHGLLASSADWVTNLPNQSLGFLLADAGFDVWLGNTRGNFYSSKHASLSHSDRRYWEFTWDEMASHDLPAMLDKALAISGRPSLHYVGHSQGTEIMFARLAGGDPSFAKKIRKFFALAPVASVAHIEGLIAFLGRYFGGHLWALRWVFGTHDFLPHTWLSALFAQIVCGQKWESPLCDNVLFQIGGPESAQFNQSRLMVYMAHTPAGTSTWNIIHWAQMRQSGRVQMFDFGSTNANLEHYGQRSPPVYNLSRLSVPTYLYYSQSDWLADAQDVQETLLGQIPGQWLKLARNLPHFNHFDFIWGLLAPEQIYTEIVRTASEHEANTRRRT